ncbi:MAG TPA: hemolysin family protein, partial [Nitrolancea sp.]|nr:hemolysin family protein [Nitrolancea sp.]
VLALVITNGFFVATEFALVSVRRSRIEALVDEGVARARPVLSALHDLDGFVAATQLGITIASIGLGWVGEPAIADVIDPVLERVLPASWANASAHTISFVIAFSLITFFHVVFGELAPKSLALQYPERTAFMVAPPVRVFLTIFRPIISAMNWVGQSFLHLIGVRPAVGHSLIYTEEELRLIVAASTESGELFETEEEIIRRAFVFHDFTADDIMVPRTELIAAPADATLDFVIDLIREHKFSQYPIYGRDLDDILGVFYVKDLVGYVLGGESERDDFDLRRVARSVLTVPESLPIDALLDEMKRHRTHLAIAVDEYGGTAGMVTLDDIMERVVGEVPDEFDQPGADIIEEPDGSARVNGLTHLSDIREHFGLELEADESSTIGGFVFSALGQRPEIGDQVVVGPYVIEVTALDGLRIAEVRFRKRSADEVAAEASQG